MRSRSAWPHAECRSRPYELVYAHSAPEAQARRREILRSGAPRSRWASLVVSIFLTLLGGCSGLPFPGISEVAPPSARERDVLVDRVLAAEGLKFLDQRRYEDASRHFNAGLKFAPTDARLHFLNGLAYHLQYMAGNEGVLGLAVAGYELALINDPAHYHAALQLGRLQFEAKQYAGSLEAFRRATEIEARSGEAYLGLASAAYYAHDLTHARAAAELAASLLPGSANALRALAMANAAAGNHQAAKDASIRYAALESVPRARARLNARLDQWRDWHVAAESSKNKIPAASKHPSQPKPSGEIEGAILPGAGAADAGSQSKAESEARPAGSKNPAQSPPAGSVRKAWFECNELGNGPALPSIGLGTAPPGIASYGPSGDGASIEPVPALPSPCHGAGNPPMVVLDVAFIRTEDVASSSYGVNLLQNLTFVFGVNKSTVDIATRNDGAETREVVVTRRRQSGTGGVDALITYSLNIANATDNRSEVLAKPSLVALDRVPSTFFSGRNITLGVAGQLAGSSIVTDRPVGVGLAVTPTFIDSETVALAIRVQRSFIEDVNLNINFNQSLQASRNVVSANVVLKMGQTLILSGLSEQETQRSFGGVPVLKDIPLLQYLFSTRTTENFTSSVLVLITPRAPMMDSEVMSRTLSHIDTLPDPEKRKYRPLIEKAMKATPGGVPDNIEGTYRHAYGNTLFLQFRSGDLSLQHWSVPSRLDAFFRDLREMLYY